MAIPEAERQAMMTRELQAAGATPSFARRTSTSSAAVTVVLILMLVEAVLKPGT